MSERSWDLVVFGASGFTGVRIALYLARVHNDKKLPHKFKWAIAGRSEAKLNDVKVQLEKEYDDVKQTEEIGLILADVSDPASLRSMCGLTRCVISAVGPYRLYGEPVVAAAVETGTDYLDVTGEPQFLEAMLLKYGERAVQTGALIIHSCGFDSIPADMGLDYTSRRAAANGAIVSQVESFLTFHFAGVTPKFHAATWESGVRGFADHSSLKKIRANLAHRRPEIPKIGPSLKVNSWPHKDPRVGDSKWVLPFPGADVTVVRSSERSILWLAEKEKRDVKQLPPLPQYAAYFTVSSWFWMVVIAFVGLVFGLLARFACTRQLLIKYPRLFSLGVFSEEGPSDADLATTSWDLEFWAYGFANAEQAIAKQLPVLLAHTKVSGPEMGYVVTPILVVHAALTVLEEKGDSRSLIPAGGVFTPRAAFYGSSLTRRLEQSGGLQFEDK